MDKRQKLWRHLGTVVFIAYLVVLAYLLFFSENYGRTDTEREYRYNLVLFREIKRYLVYYEQLGIENVIINLLGNIVAFMPYGFWAPIIKKASCKNGWNVFFWSFRFSLVVEVIQLVTKTGAFDVDDLMLNTIGGLLGFAVYKMFQQYHQRKHSAARKQ